MPKTSLRTKGQCPKPDEISDIYSLHLVTLGFPFSSCSFSMRSKLSHNQATALALLSSLCSTPNFCD